MANATPFYTRSPKTIVVYPINGQTEFTIPFEFLARKFVVVTLLGVDRLPLVLNTDYRFVSVNRIQLLSPVPAGYPNIELRRLTSATDRLVDFHDGSILRAYDLNLAQIQTMHVAEEARDLTADNIGVNDNGDLDARNRKIVNLANGTEPNDAVNLGQLRQFDTSTANNADRAVQAMNRAVQAETNTARDSASAAVNAAKAVASAGTAVQAASDANRSYEKIVPLEQSTVANAQVATQQAQRAQNEADRAKSEADKLANMNDLADAVQSVDAVSKGVNFKGSVNIGLSGGNHYYFSVYSKKDSEQNVSRKGYVGVPTPNADYMALGSDTGNVRLLTNNGRLEVGANQLHAAVNRLLLSRQDNNDCYIDIASRNSENKFHRLYSGGNRFAMTENVATSGEWLRDMISSFPHPSDTKRGCVDFGRGTIHVLGASGSTWVGASGTDEYAAGVLVKPLDNGYPTNTAVAAVSLKMPPHPNNGRPSGISFGTLAAAAGEISVPYIWAHSHDSNVLRAWQFQMDGRIRSFTESGGFGYSTFSSEFAPVGDPQGAACQNGMGMIQWRYGRSVKTNSAGWNRVNYTVAFPHGTLAVIVCNMEHFGEQWPRNVSAINASGFNVTGGSNELWLSYIAIGY